MFEGTKVSGTQVQALQRGSSGGHGGHTGRVVVVTDTIAERKTCGSKSTPSQGNRPRSEGGSGDGRVNVDMGPGPSTEEPLRVGTRWISPRPYWRRTFPLDQVQSHPPQVLAWVEAGGGKAIISLDLLNSHEVRSVPSPNHASARDDIGSVAVRAQAFDEGGVPGSIEKLCPF